MKIKPAKTSGFCMGVRRAMELALEAVHTQKGPIYSYGPLIHNPQAVDLLSSKGLQELEPGEWSPETAEGGTVIIRAHGIPPQERRRLEESGFKVIDATCPRVIRVQAIIKKHTAQGFTPIIWGNPSHPEVVGLLGHADGRGLVITGPEDVPGLPDLDKVILVAQTTQNKQMLSSVVDAVTARWPEALVFDTICGATQRRQDEVSRLSGQVEAMVVVGGHNSGNTTRLAAVARETGVKTIHIETEKELEPDWLDGVGIVGITAGASTPNWMIKRVMRELERIAHKSDTSFYALAYQALRLLLLSNLYVAFGAGVLCLAGAMLQGLPPRGEYFGVAFFYIHAMHMLNLFLDKEAGKFNDPDRARFLEGHRTVLLGSGIFSALVGLFFSLTISLGAFLLLAFMSALGLLYAVPLTPRSWSRFTRLRRLKDIPSSKTLFLSGGWALTLSLIPALSPEGRLGWPTLIVGLIIFLMVFIRSALGDIIEIQGDRVVGRETIPIIIGEKKTLDLLNVAVGVFFLSLILGWVFGLLTSLAVLLIPCAAYAALYLVLFRREPVIGGTFFEALIDANFILAGLLSWFWAVVWGG
ncbi:MAG: 4-hydroxy-3-methylbut-2-enyl diphosphate reductase [Thermodesulfobacteriota bacterium]|nr:4-hydroxy-3-methylbut-2-enyl diphosphate reductase [Thermodesulfobacteriota bacterium]